MDKNENGYPNVGPGMGGIVGGVTDENRPGNGCNRPGYNGGCNGGCNGNGNQNGGTVGGIQTNHSCGGDGTCLDTKPLAYVYAPNQFFRMLYSANDALKHGTLFEELYKPTEVYGRE